MSTITPILDTLLHQVFGRRADIERFTATQPNAPLNAIARIVAAEDGTAHTDTAADRVATARDTQLDASRQAESRTRATEAATPQRGRTDQSVSAKTPAPPDSAALHFSREARSIASLLGRFAQAPNAATQAQAPLFSGTQPPLAPVLASLLGRQLADSGVFYESHLSKWIEGRHTLAELAREPQAQLGRASSAQGGTPSSGAPAGSAAATNSAAPTTPGAPTGASAPPAGEAESGISTDMLPSRHAIAAAGRDAGSGGDGLIHEQLLPVVRQQLDVLSSAIFRWQGMAWPGVPMQWEVREDPREQARSEHPSGDADTERYSTRLTLDLPTLGPLQVRMSVAEGGLQMYAWAGSDAGVQALAPQTELLEQRLRRAGFDSANVRLITGMPA